MSHDFKLKYNQLRENDPTQIDLEKNYPAESSIRNVCFIQSDGKRLFLNYGYLISGEFIPYENKIILGFTSHTISMVGMQMETMFLQLMNHFPQTIVCKDERYNGIEENKSVVNSMEILKV